MSCFDSVRCETVQQAQRRFRSAFTLVELMIVIGILGVLTAVLLSVTSKGTESARAAKCLSNMRSLAQAVSAAATEIGQYPAAGSYQKLSVGGNKLIYVEVRGWISWLSNEGDPFGHLSGNAAPTSPVDVPIATFNEKNEENRIFSLTNGAIWKATGRNVSIYRCPNDTKKATPPNFSYVMNGKFGYDYSQGTKGLDMHIDFGTLARADRTLLFSEFGGGGGSGKYAQDCTLQYKATLNGHEYGKIWDGAPESIGFAHKGPRGRRCAHLAFADGHTEKLLEPLGGNGLKMEELTALLCEGRDFSFTGSAYEEIKDTD